MCAERGKHTLHSLSVLESVFSPPSLDLDNLKLMEVNDTNPSLFCCLAFFVMQIFSF